MRLAGFRQEASYSALLSRITANEKLGAAQARRYRDNLDKPGFHTGYDLAPFEAVPAANYNHGLIIIAGGS